MTHVSLPNYTIGEGATETLAALLKGKRVAIVSGEKSWAAAKPRLPELSVCTHHLYGGECSPTSIGAAANAAAKAGAEALLGIGGGKALDVAKAAAHRLHLPVYTLPTIAATCAAVTRLSVVYHEDGTFDSFWRQDQAPAHAAIDTALLATAPARYLRAGIADAVAKGIEPVFSARGDGDVNYASRLGLTASAMCVAPLLACGAEAYADNLKETPTSAFEEALQGVIVSTGMVSLLVDEMYNGAIAHSVCYGLDELPGLQARALHGELVGYGCLVQLAVDSAMGDEPYRQEAASLLPRLGAFLRSMDIPVTLAGFGVACDEGALAPMLRVTPATPDMEHVPYPVDKDMLLAAMRAVEAMG